MENDELKQIEAELSAAEEALEGEPAPEVAAEAATEPEPLNNAEHVQAVISTAVTVLTPMFPSLQKVYTPEVTKALADATVPLANKYQVNVLGWMQRWAEEIAFATIAIPVGMSTYGAIMHDLKAKEQNAPPPDDVGGGPAPAPAEPKQDEPAASEKVHKLKLRDTE